MRAGSAPDGASLISVRVSRDSGRSYERPAVVVVPHQWAADQTDPLAAMFADRWPPCRCPLHR